MERIGDLATSPDAAARIARWQQRRVGRDGPDWVVAGAALDPALDALDLVVPMQADPVLARTARFSEGARHTERRAAAVAALPGPAGLRDAARSATAAALPAAGRVDVAPLAYEVPVRVLAAAMGCPELVEPVHALCRAGIPGADPSLLADPVRTGLLVQCRDATAALVAGTLCGEPPRTLGVVLTRRRARAEVRLDAETLPAGADVWLLLGEQRFGGGRHACPGRDVATALADGVVDAVRAARRVVEAGPYERRPNLRMPSTVWTEPA